MLDVQVATLANQAMNYLVSGKVPKRNGNAHPNIQPQDVYACADGDVILVVGNDGQFAKLCEVFGRPEWVSDERFATNAQRVRNIGELSAMLRDHFARMGARTPDRRARRRGRALRPDQHASPTCSRTRRSRRAACCSTCRTRAASTCRRSRRPMRFAERRLQTQTAPPLLGQHSDEILGELGYGAADIAALRAAGAI